MPNAFIPLYEYVRSAQSPVSALCEIPPETPIAAIAEPALQSEMPFEDVFADLRRFRARLAEALDMKLEQVLRECACDVIGRELLLQPAEIRSIVHRLVDGIRDDRTVLRIHPDDIPQIADAGDRSIKCDVQIVADSQLFRGDAILELSSGSIDARLGVRLDRILRDYTSAGAG